MQEDKTMMQYVYLSVAGEVQQGGPGCTYVDADKGRALYMKTENMNPEAFKKSLRQMQEEDDGKHYFVVTKTENNLHVFKFSRERAAKYDWSQIMPK